jgi:hypothetical protein
MSALTDFVGVIVLSASDEEMLWIATWWIITAMTDLVLARDQTAG